MWLVEITFSDNVKMTEEISEFWRVRELFQIWREEVRPENERPVIKVFPPYSLIGATA